MSTLPSKLRGALEETLDTRVRRATPLGGGMINRAACVETTDGPVFLKWQEAAPPDFFASEAFGLALLRDANALRVPAVLATGQWPFDRSETAGTAVATYLALEYIPSRPPSDPARFARRFGEGLAALHQTSPTDFAGFGLPQSNYIGRLPQHNTPLPDWPAFYRERRLLPQIALARQNRRLPPARERLLMEVVERLEALLDGLESQPALLHGDLWSGNFLTAGDEPVLIDPAIYYGERETEIAYMELFGGFPDGVLSAYRAAAPLAPGYERRRPLHQLYPLLVHLNHFGETYGPDVEAACQVSLL